MITVSKMLKRVVLASFVMFGASVFAASDTNKTFFSPRPQGVNLPMQMSIWYDHIHSNKTPVGGSIQLTPFFQQSTNGTDLAEYFMFDCLSCLRVKAAPTPEGFSAGADGAHIHPFNFNLGTAFESIISFDPEQEVYGVRFDYHHDLDGILSGLYLSVAAPVVHVSNDPGFCERVIIADKSSSNVRPSTVSEALAGARLSSDWSERWCFGKIACTQSATGLADIDVKLGYNVLDEKNYRLGIELGLTIPTGNKARGRYMWEAIVGNGFHWGFGGGLHGSYKIWKDKKRKNHHLTLSVMGDYRYLFDNTQVRTLELKCKKWGRHIRMRQLNPFDETKVLPNSLPGINVMTRSVKVEPGSQIDAMASVDYSCGAWKFGIGYNLWWREAEDLSLKCNWYAPGKFGLISKDGGFDSGVSGPASDASASLELVDKANATGDPEITLQPGQGIGQFLKTDLASRTISSKTTIHTYGEGDGIIIRECDVDLDGHPSVLTHKIFASIGYSLKKVINEPSFVGIGGSYEFGDGRKGLEQWAIWAKFGISC